MNSYDFEILYLDTRLHLANPGTTFGVPTFRVSYSAQAATLEDAYLLAWHEAQGSLRPSGTHTVLHVVAGSTVTTTVNIWQPISIHPVAC